MTYSGNSFCVSRHRTTERLKARCQPLGASPITLALPEMRDFDVGKYVAPPSVTDELGSHDRGAHQPASLMSRTEKTMADLMSQHAPERATHIRRRRLAAANRVIELEGIQQPDEPPDRRVVKMNRRTLRYREAPHPRAAQRHRLAVDCGGTPSFTWTLKYQAIDGQDTDIDIARRLNLHTIWFPDRLHFVRHRSEKEWRGCRRLGEATSTSTQMSAAAWLALEHTRSATTATQRMSATIVGT